MQDAGKITTELFYSFLKTSQSFEERICGRIVFDKVVGRKPSDCITQKWHSNRCFLWNIAKFFKATTFLWNTQMTVSETRKLIIIWL